MQRKICIGTICVLATLGHISGVITSDTNLLMIAIALAVIAGSDS